MMIDLYCSDTGCKKAICLDCIDAHRGHVLCKLSKVTDEMEGILREKVKELGAHDIAITAGISKVKQAKAACDKSTAACLVAISAAADAQRAEVIGAPAPIPVPRDALQGSFERFMQDTLTPPPLAALGQREHAAIATNEATLMWQTAEVQHPTTLSGQDIDLSLAQMGVSVLKTTSDDALRCHDVSNRYIKITRVLEQIAQLPVESWPLEPKTCGETTFLRASAEEQAADVTALGQLRDEDLHRAAVAVAIFCSARLCIRLRSFLLSAPDVVTFYSFFFLYI